MWEIDRQLFPVLEEQCGSRFMATMFVAKAARKLSRHLPKGVTESKLLTWVITGDVPDINYLYTTYYNQNPELREVDDFLCYVEDERIVVSVRKSYKQSINLRNLSYFYEPELNEHEQARVRVLLRMLWYLE